MRTIVDYDTLISRVRAARKLTASCQYLRQPDSFQMKKRQFLQTSLALPLLAAGWSRAQAQGVGVGAVVAQYAALVHAGYEDTLAGALERGRSRAYSAAVVVMRLHENGHREEVFRDEDLGAGYAWSSPQDALRHAVQCRAVHDMQCRAVSCCTCCAMLCHAGHAVLAMS